MKRNKRSRELEAAEERSSYASFVAAANAVSQLYTAGVREQRRTTKATLEKVLAFVLREHPTSDVIPKAALIQWLQSEYERADHPDTMVPPGAAGMMPFMVSATSAASSGDEGPENDLLAGGGSKAVRPSSGGRSRAFAGPEEMQQQYMQQQAQYQQQFQQQQQQHQFQHQPQHQPQQAGPQFAQQPGLAMETNEHAFAPQFG